MWVSPPETVELACSAVVATWRIAISVLCLCSLARIIEKDVIGRVIPISAFALVTVSAK
jgi:hypothetical protein